MHDNIARIFRQNQVTEYDCKRSNLMSQGRSQWNFSTNGIITFIILKEKKGKKLKAHLTIHINVSFTWIKGLE